MPVPLVSSCKNGFKKPDLMPKQSSAWIKPKQADVKPTPAPVGINKKVFIEWSRICYSYLLNQAQTSSF